MAGGRGNPKSEARNPKEIRNPKSERSRFASSRQRLRWVRISDFFRASDFGFRILTLPIHLKTKHKRPTNSAVQRFNDSTLQRLLPFRLKRMHIRVRHVSDDLIFAAGR